MNHNVANINILLGGGVHIGNIIANKFGKTIFYYIANYHNLYILPLRTICYYILTKSYFTYY